MRNMIRAAAVCMTAWLVAGTQAWAQNWNGTKLNDIAVTNETGAIIVLGTEGSYGDNPALAKETVFDGNTSTFFDPDGNAARAQACWAGIQLQLPKIVTRVRYWGRGANPGRMRGCLFQGANMPDFSDALTLHVANPPSNWGGTSWVEELVTSTNALQAFTYLRIIGPNLYGGTSGEAGTCCGNAAEVEFYGMDRPVFDNAPPVPVLSFSNAVNWRVNLRWTITADAMCYEVQRKLAHETEFISVLQDAFRAAGTRTWADPFALAGSADYRIRAHNTEGPSAWVDLPIQPRNAAVGRWFGTAGSYNNEGAIGDRLYDGNIDTGFDAPTVVGETPDIWSALDLGEPRAITSVRYMPRPNFVTRMVGGRFEAAHNMAFIDAVTLHTVSTQPPANVMTEAQVPVWLDSIRYRYVRFITPYNGYGNAQEIEFLLAPDTLAAPTGLAVVSSDFTNDYAALSWQVPTKTLFSSSIVYRATAPGGPYTAQTPAGLAPTVTTWTDTDLVPGIAYFYKVVSAFADGAAVQEGSLPDSPFVSFRRSERLERTWDDNSQLKEGLAYFNIGGTYNDDPSRDADKIFDGLFDTFADIKPATGTLGVDFQTPHAISKARFAPRSGNAGRVNGAVLCGADDFAAIPTTTAVLATFAGGVANTYTWVATTNTDAYRYVFATRYDGDFYGNLAELELYGWPESNLADVLTAPTDVTFTPNTPSVQISWTAGRNAASYRVERAPVDTPDAWEQVGTANTPSLTDTAPVWGTNCLYRIASVRLDGQNTEEFAWSESIPFTAYMPGNGTGLTGYYSSDFTKAYSPDETLRFTCTNAVIDFVWTGNPIIPDVPASTNNVQVIWNGKLIVPHDGVYTFHATTDDGVALRIDGAFIINDWQNVTNTRSASVTLTAGPHDIRMDYYQATGGTYARLEWDGAVTRAIIPATQLIPAPLEDTSPWQGRTFNAPKLGSHAIDETTGAITVSSGGMDFHGATEGYHFVWQPVRGPFLFEAKVTPRSEGIPSAKAMLMMRDTIQSGSTLLAAGYAATTNAIYGGKQRLTSGTAIANTFDPWLTAATPAPRWLRLKRAKAAVSMAIRSEGGEWETFYNDAVAGAAFTDDVLVGVAFSASAVNPDGKLPGAVFSDIRLIPLTGTVLLVQ